MSGQELRYEVSTAARQFQSTLPTAGWQYLSGGGGVSTTLGSRVKMLHNVTGYKGPGYYPAARVARVLPCIVPFPHA